MSEIEDRVLDNMKFRDILKDNLVNNPWLLNYEKGKAIISIEDDKTQSSLEGEGTVYTRTWQTGKNEYTVVPSIMENKEGNLEYSDNNNAPFERGYGIKFSNEKEANDFAHWLHELHQMSGETQQSYDI